MIFIGIDNGLSGGMVAISDTAAPGRGGSIIDMTTMPTVRRGDGKEIDAAKVARWVKSTVGSHKCVVAVEECPPHAQQKSIMRSMAFSYGLIVGAVIAGTGHPVTRVKSGNPLQSWQRAMLGAKVPQGTTKPAAIVRAAELWPDETFIPPGCRTPNTGLVDAALIAEFLRIHLV